MHLHALLEDVFIGTATLTSTQERRAPTLYEKVSVNVWFRPAQFALKIELPENSETADYLVWRIEDPSFDLKIWI